MQAPYFQHTANHWSYKHSALLCFDELPTLLDVTGRVTARSSHVPVNSEGRSCRKGGVTATAPAGPKPLAAPLGGLLKNVHCQLLQPAQLKLKVQLPSWVLEPYCPAQGPARISRAPPAYLAEKGTPPIP